MTDHGWRDGWPDRAALAEVPDGATIELAIEVLEGGRFVVPCAISFLLDAPEDAQQGAQAELDRAFEFDGVTQGPRWWRMVHGAASTTETPYL